jgi:aromatic-L-amino-acid/L-tryptophan decarboxylase
MTGLPKAKSFAHAARRRERTLDPEDWEAFRALAHRVLDEAIDYVRDVRKRKPWTPLPDSAKAALSAPLPARGQPLEKTYREFRKNIFPYPLGNIHPRHWGWVNGSGTPEGILAEMLAAAMNSNVTGHDQAPVWAELQVIGWFKQLFRLPAAAGGLLVSGATMANLTALLAARTYAAGCHVRDAGLAEKGGQRFTIYGSREAHYCIPRALDIMGLGRNAFRAISTNDDFTIDLDALRPRIAEDRAKGFTPLALVGTAGTVNTGAIDPLNALADIAREEGLWFHVDGAFGAVAAFSEMLRPRLKGLTRADSIAFDLHKWLSQPYGMGCVLVRNAEHLKHAFQFDPTYFRPLEGGVSKAVVKFNDLGLEHSRRFRALSIWFSLKTRGAKTFVSLIEQNVRQAAWLGRRIVQSKTLELMAPVALNVVAFRFNPGSLPEDQVNLLNNRLLIEIQNRGIAVPSSTFLNGAFCLRVAIVNHRSREADFEALAAAAETIGRELAAKLARGA